MDSDEEQQYINEIIKEQEAQGFTYLRPQAPIEQSVDPDVKIQPSSSPNLHTE